LREEFIMMMLSSACERLWGLIFDPLFVIPWGHAHDTTESPPECGLITISAGVGDLRNRFARDFQHKRRRFNTNPRDKDSPGSARSFYD
jgi:hypothetical protein